MLKVEKVSADDIRAIIKGELRSVLMNIYEMERNRLEVCVRENCQNDSLRLEGYGFKVFSQNEEDGLIEEIFNRIGVTNKVFVEFGIQTGLESNCHYLLHKGFSGLWIEGSKSDCERCRTCFKRPIAEGRLVVVNAFITKDNIDSLIKNNIASLSLHGTEIDLLSIDIDGNDYYVWQAIKCIQPRVVVIEYNSKFPPNIEWVMEYDEHHIWAGDDNFGASLKSYELLGKKLGYQLVGTNSTGSNAFFVRIDLAEGRFFEPATAEALYSPPRYWLRYQSGHPSKKYIGR